MIKHTGATAVLHDLFDPDVMDDQWPETCTCVNCAPVGHALTPDQVGELYQVLYAEGKHPEQDVLAATLRTFYPECTGRTLRKPTWREKLRESWRIVWSCLKY